MTEYDVADVFERLPGLINADASLVRRGRYLSCDFQVGCPGLPVLLTLREGAIVGTVRGPALMRPWRFAIRAEAEAWRRFWQPAPEPGYHDLLAMTRFGAAAIDGDLQPLMANLRYIKELIEAPRRAGIGAFETGDGDGR